MASNVALKLAKQLQKRPRELAEALVSHLDLRSGAVTKVEIGGPGFINFWLADSAIAETLRTILSEGSAYGRSNVGEGRRVNVEFVSANPTGPLHVGHGRGAALGDAIASLLEATGYEVVREFYVNDAGTQIDLLARSVWARVQQLVGRRAEIPGGGYHGEYLAELAQQIIADEGAAFADLPKQEALERCKEITIRQQREEQDRDLAEFGVKFDVVYRESELYGSGLVVDALTELVRRSLTYEQDGALWLRTSEYGDEKDRVLRKKDGSYTYFLPDIAYHMNKAGRAFDRAMDVWGADHHGYINRMKAALRALGLAEDFFQVVLVQLVRVMREGVEIRFSKRSGDFVTLKDLVNQTGVDAARYFFLMRKGDAQFIFDIDLATKQSEENPVYYVQYAHTRMSGILRTANLVPGSITVEGVNLGVLSSDAEQALMKHLASFPTTVMKAASAYEPHRIIGYLEELARLVNSWYHGHRAVGVGGDLQRARLVLVRSVQIVLANGLRLMGVTAPERM